MPNSAKFDEGDRMSADRATLTEVYMVELRFVQIASLTGDDQTDRQDPQTVAFLALFGLHA
jgi:hypothetical protein